MTKYFFTLFSSITLHLLCSHTYAGIPEYEINCGVGAYTNDIFTVSKTTTNVPFVTRQTNPNYAFGCVVKYLQGEFSLRSNITIPNPKPRTLTTNAHLSTAHQKDSLLIKSEPKTFDKIGYVGLQLDNSDLTGNYLLEIYINNNFARRVSFNVNK